MANRIFTSIMIYTKNASLMYTLGLWKIYVNYCHNIMLKTKKLQGIASKFLQTDITSAWNLHECDYFDTECNCKYVKHNWDFDDMLGFYPFLGYEFVTYDHDMHEIKELYCYHNGPIYGIRKSIGKCDDGGCFYF